MANFSGLLNLLGFKGARVFTHLDEKHPDMAWVCIPVPYNDIQITQDGKYASARVFMAETNDKYRQTCIQRKQQSGDDMTGYTPPSHQMEVSFSPEFRQRALAAATWRIPSITPTCAMLCTMPCAVVWALCIVISARVAVSRQPPPTLPPPAVPKVGSPAVSSPSHRSRKPTTCPSKMQRILI